MNERTDVELLQAHVDGDPAAFEVLVRRHRDRMWAVALRTLRDPEEAADALQEALVSAYRAAGSFRAESAVTTWLHRIVVNACLDRIRRRSARPTTPLGDIDPPQRGDESAAAELRVDFDRALASLPEGQRLALVLVDLQGLPVAEAAQILGVAEGTVKSRCARGRAALAPLLRLTATARNRTPHAGVPPATTETDRAQSSRPTSRAEGGELDE